MPTRKGKAALESPAMPANVARKRGRPKIERSEELVLVQTRIPEALRSYLKAIAAYRFKTLINMHELALTRFLADRPYENGLDFRKPRAAEDTGWVQVNILLPAQLAERVRADAANLGISVASYTYTVLFWWATYVHPPQRAA